MNGTRRRHDSVQFAETAARNHPAVTLRRPERPTRPGQRLQSPQLTENTGVDAGLQLDHCDLEEGTDGLGGALDVSGEASVDAGPGEGALDDPALGLDDEAGIGALDDLYRAGGGRGDAGPLVAAVREDAFEEREAPGDPIEDQGRAVAFLDAGGVHLDAQHQAEGV